MDFCNFRIRYSVKYCYFLSCMFQLSCRFQIFGLVGNFVIIYNIVFVKLWVLSVSIYFICQEIRRYNFFVKEKFIYNWCFFGIV